MSEGSSWSQTTGRGSRVSGVQPWERPGSADPSAGSWSGTGAPCTSDWGDWDSGAATGRTVPVHTCSHYRTSVLLSQMGGGGGGGRSGWPAVYTYVAYVSSVHTPTGNTFSASVLVLRKTLFTGRVLKHRSRLLRAILDCSSLGTFRI